MSGFLGRLAARATGHSDGLRPRVQSRFEPLTLEETTFTTAAPEPTTARAARDVPVPPRGSRADARVPDEDALARPSASAPPIPNRTPTRVPADRTRGPAPVDVRSAREAARDEAPPPMPTAVATEPTAPESAAFGEIVVDRFVEVPADGRSGTDDAFGHVGLPTRPAARRGALAPVAPRPTMSRRGSETERAPVEPVVSVTIGRVEIRAHVPPVAARAARPDAAPTRLTPLEEYVEQRVKGAR